MGHAIAYHNKAHKTDRKKTNTVAVGEGTGEDPSISFNTKSGKYKTCKKSSRSCTKGIKKQ